MTTPFGRQVIVQIGRAGQQGRSIQGLRTSAKCKHSPQRSSSSATIQIYNPAPETIALLEPSDAVVRLLAGYDVPRQIWLGTPVKGGVRVERQGPTRVLTIESKDTSRQFERAIISISYAGAVSLEELLEDVASQIGISRRAIRVNNSPRLVDGAHYSGPPGPFLDQLAQDLGADWGIVDGALQVLTKGQASGRRAPLLSSKKKNLIGAPTIQDKGLVTATALLEADLRPRDSFVLESERYNGEYVARDVVFDIDSWDGPFYTIVTGKAAA